MTVLGQHRKTISGLSGYNFSQLLLGVIWASAIALTAGLIPAASWFSVIVITYIAQKRGFSANRETDESLSLLEIFTISLWGIAPCLVWLSDNPNRLTVSATMIACGFLIILGHYKADKRPAFIVATPYALLCAWQLHRTFGSTEFAYIAMAATLLFGTFTTMMVFSIRAQKQIQKTAEEQRLLIKALEQAKAKAEASDKFKSQFLANMSHEIRTPLNGIVGLSEVLKENDFTEKQNTIVSTINNCGLTLLDIVNDILDLSKIEAGGIELDPKPFTLQSELVPLYHLWKKQAAAKDIQFKLLMSKSVPKSQLADFPRIKQCLTNLIGNALKFTEEGQVTLNVQSCDIAGQEGLKFIVTDTGVGIPKDKLSTVFQPFKQSDISVSRTFGGTGLGLTITKRLCSLMGGTLSVESVEGKGTRFTFCVPAQRVETASPSAHSLNAQPSQPLPANPLPSNPASDGEPQNPAQAHLGRILVVDDVEMNLEVLKVILAMWPVTVDTASTGMAAIAKARACNYHAILMDIRMPEMDGVATMMSIRSLNDHCAAMPIIAISANAMAHEAQSYLEAGMTDFAPKPITVDAITQIIDTHLAGDGHAAIKGIHEAA